MTKPPSILQRHPTRFRAKPVQEETIQVDFDRALFFTFQFQAFINASDTHLSSAIRLKPVGFPPRLVHTYQSTDTVSRKKPDPGKKLEPPRQWNVVEHATLMDQPGKVAPAGAARRPTPRLPGRLTPRRDSNGGCDRFWRAARRQRRASGHWPARRRYGTAETRMEWLSWNGQFNKTDGNGR